MVGSVEAECVAVAQPGAGEQVPAVGALGPQGSEVRVLQGDLVHGEHGSAGGRPPAFDAEDYKQRNVIERSFNWTKQWRGLASRYDKLALVYRGGLVLRTITLWLA